MLLENHNAIEVGGYAISNSLRFQSASTQYLSRTQTSGNRRTWTWSSWVKRGTLGVDQKLFGAGNGSTNLFGIGFGSGNLLEVFQVNTTTQFNWNSTQVFRDPSAWYHIVVSVDTTQATASNRLQVYLNGSLITANNGSYPSLNFDTWINFSGYEVDLGKAPGQNSIDGYLAEVNFVDGQALTPSSFGETDLITGQWVAKKYTGTYGTNGFYLPFSNGTSTTTLGADSSGNSNNWTLNNFTRSAGVSDCWMIDVPSGNGGASGTQPSSNYCVLNTLDKGNATLSKANLNLVRTSSTTDWEHARSTIQVPSTGKWYFEMTFNSGSTDGACFGVCTSAFSLNSDFAPGTYANAYAWLTNPVIVYANTSASYGSSPANGDVMMCAFDRDNSTLYFGKNGTWFNSSNPVTGTSPAISSVEANVFPFFGARSTANADANFGQRSFAYTPPTGFKALCTANLPAATIKKGNQYMDATTYSGSASNVTITNGGFQPDLVWMKCRSNADDHALVDSVRGVTPALYSNSTSAEVSAGYLQSFNSNGATITTGFGTTNISGRTYVAWQWDAGSSTVTNTSGTISSQVRANPTAGVSVVTYTGAGAAGTVGHGLGVAPKMFITKRRDTSENWNVYHASVGNTGGLSLNITNGTITNIGYWNNTSPTSTTLSIGTYQTTNAATYVAYCFAEISGFSKFGSYTGNGSADGPFVYLGFRPKFFMWKRTDVTANPGWTIVDSSRNTYNYVDLELVANSSAAESAGGASFNEDFLANGIKFRNTGAGANASGGTYIYAAFAENPFQNSNAR